MVVSGVGFVLFSYGRKQRRMPHAVIGLVMMIYPYVVTSIVPMLSIMVAMCLLLWAATYFGM